VLPHVTDKGHKTLIRSHMQARYKDMPCVGGYLDGPLSKMGEGTRRILAGEDSAWGNKRVAVFQTSDSRSHAGGSRARHRRSAGPGRSTRSTAARVAERSGMSISAKTNNRKAVHTRGGVHDADLVLLPRGSMEAPTTISSPIAR
jgi:hypothetical protein